MRTPAQSDPRYGAYLRVRWQPAAGSEAPATPDVFAVEGDGGNRLWLVPSLEIAILRIGRSADAGWDEARIPNLIVRGARDFAATAAPPGPDVSALVPGHQP